MTHILFVIFHRFINMRLNVNKLFEKLYLTAPQKCLLATSKRKPSETFFFEDHWTIPIWPSTVSPISKISEWILCQYHRREWVEKDQTYPAVSAIRFWKTKTKQALLKVLWIMIKKIGISYFFFSLQKFVKMCYRSKGFVGRDRFVKAVMCLYAHKKKSGLFFRVNRIFSFFSEKKLWR